MSLAFYTPKKVVGCLNCSPFPDPYCNIALKWRVSEKGSYGTLVYKGHAGVTV